MSGVVRKDSSNI